ncbi:MAG: Fic family protein [Bacteroidales bacterium]|nr:Fic family protein [Bacteroidales bacterium]
MWNELEQLRSEYLSLDLQGALDYEKFCMISIVYHSTKIEGCSLTETDTRMLIENDISANGKPLNDHLMVKDHYQAFQFIKEKAVLKSKLTTEFLQEIGAQVLKSTGGIVNTALGSFDISKGDLRLSQVYVDKKYFPSYSKVPALMEQLCESVNDKIDTVSGSEIIKLAADAHYNFVNIHPFGDGNGRASRLLMNYIQLYHGEPLIKIFTEDRAAYIDALNKTEETENPEIFRDFICSQQIKFYKNEIAKFKSKDNDFRIL